MNVIERRSKDILINFSNGSVKKICCKGTYTQKNSHKNYVENFQFCKYVTLVSTTTRISISCA